MVHSIYSETRPEWNPTIWKHINLTVEKKERQSHRKAPKIST